ncbi:cleft lip and palate transmembrane protein 1 homolog [Nephila pilipes]|uniref:Cleft lip and palate transmembrane protein 1 homolog n=1 Tax=Nephila pilipes TaxID=299642 RepID=A0A8X6PAM3_NEPPI|nr:cleft lip and palate transmembrane protein 1 homolog [Nephila pilipes]
MSSEENTAVASVSENANAPQAREGDGQNAQSPPAQNPPVQHSFWSILKGIILRAVIIYFITSFFRRPQTPTPAAQNSGMPTKTSQNLFENGTIMDLYVYVSEEEKLSFKKDSLIWYQPDIIYGDWYGGPNGDGTYTLETQIDTTENMQKNCSIWLHTCVVRHGRSPNPKDRKRRSWGDGVCKSKRMNKYKKLRYQRTHNLLTGETSASAEDIKKAEENPLEILSHWHPNLTVNIIDDHTAWVQGHVPPPLDEFVEFEPVSGDYFPILYINDYWNLIRDYTPINETVKNLPIHLTFQPLSLFRWQLYTAQAMRSRWTSFLGQDLMEESDEDQDYMKEALLETSPILLGLTFVVSIVHSIFEFLAFKNDIQFWNNRKSLEGLSVRSVFFNVFQSIVVLLYVLDNDTNMVVRISVFVGLLIEIWKIHKVTNVEINREQKILGIIPRIRLTDKGSYVESSTKQFDILAFRYLSWALFPLLGCYAVYSLIYLEHKGWYSWVLGMLYGFLLTFGFIMMTPQLFINYKLKSVAHLPWRMLSYKFLNTFIDDIFAFVIKMPTMYRLGCFRDDIVFFIYLYQRWIYRVDPKRMNEFGTSGEIEIQRSEANGTVCTTTEKPLEEKKQD